MGNLLDYFLVFLRFLKEYLRFFRYSQYIEECQFRVFIFLVLKENTEVLYQYFQYSKNRDIIIHFIFNIKICSPDY